MGLETMIILIVITIFILSKVYSLGKEKGHKDGFQKGHSQGQKAGHKVGYTVGKRTGSRKGYYVGKKDGSRIYRKARPKKEKEESSVGKLIGSIFIILIIILYIVLKAG